MPDARDSSPEDDWRLVPYIAPSGHSAWGRCRIYCSVEHARRVFMYDGVIKRWRAFDKADRQRCERGRADVASGRYDEEEREYLYHDYCQKRQTNGPA
jgi:hypothetical protein